MLEKYAAFEILQDRTLYKLAIIASSLAALEVARRCIKELWGDELAIVAASLAVVAFQVRGYHDPFLAYSGMIQTVSICTLCSLIAFARYLRTRTFGLFATSIALYFISCTIYEVAHLFAPLYLMAACSRVTFRATARLCLPFAARAI